MLAGHRHENVFTVSAFGQLTDTYVEVSDPWEAEALAGITVLKLDTDGNPLAGAGFQIITPDSEVVVDKLTADESGTLFDSGSKLQLDVEYQLVETKAPEGHQLLAEPVGFKVTETGIEITSGGSENIVVDADNAFQINVTDVPRGILPMTGGSGIGIFGLTAALLLAAAGAVVAQRRKKAHQA